MRRLTRAQLVEGVVAGRHRNALGADRVGCGHIPGRVPNDHDATVAGRTAGSLCTTGNRSTKNKLAQQMIAAVATKSEPPEQIHATQLDLCAAHHVPGAKAHEDVLFRITQIQDRGHPRANEEIGGAGRLVGEGLDVDGDQGVHLGLKRFACKARFGPSHKPLHRASHDRPVGHAIESELQGLWLSVSGLEGSRHRSPSGASRAQEGPVDIKEQQRRLHGFREIAGDEGGIDPRTAAGAD